MAFNYSSFTTICNCLDKIAAQRKSNETIRVLSIGYPDFIVERSVLKKSKYSQVFNQCVISNQSAAMQWHSLDPQKFVALSLFEALRFIYSLDASYADIDSGTGVSEKDSQYINIDLNQSLDHQPAPFDLILDSGTSEHCFNIAQVFSTYHSLLACGGYLYQWSPFLSPNHGFYSLNPTLYFDLDREGIFRLISFDLHAFRSYRWFFKCKSRSIFFRRTQKFRIWPWNLSATLLNEVVMKRGDSSFVHPIQSKYLPSSQLLMRTKLA